MKVFDTNGKEYGKPGYVGNFPMPNWTVTPRWLCGSCGARFEISNKKTDLRRIHNGIRIVTGHIQQDEKTDAYVIKQLNTKAGPITVSVRKAAHASRRT